MDTSKICIYNILTYNFFNTAHKDNDGMHVRNSEEIVDYIMKSKLPQLIKWLESFWKAFGRKETLPMPTNCCWTLVELSYFWIHVSYFLMVDLRLAYDVSSDVMVDIGEHGKAGQVGANVMDPW